MSEELRPAATPRSAVLDPAHEGEIRGALGSIPSSDRGRPWSRRLLTLAAIMGPGLIVMIGDNDAGGVSTYAQAGQDYGTTLLWVLLLCIPTLIVAQEMVVRLGAVTGVGHARLIKERFGRFWAAFSVGDLFLLNFLTLVTEFIGVDLSLRYFGVTPLASVPIVAIGLLAMVATGSFQLWERFMFVFIVTSLLMFPLALLSHPSAEPVVKGLFVPTVQGGFTSTSVLFIIAVVGTTIAPWQLFFQQSNVIDKRITTRWLKYELADTSIGAVVTTAGGGAIMLATAFAFAHTGLAGQFGSGLTVAEGLSRRVGSASGAIFAIVLVNASVIGASAVTLSTSYALGDSFGLKHSLHRKVGDAKGFYLSFAGLIALAAGVVLIPRAPLGLITTGVQVLAGVLLPSAIVFLLLLCNDAEVLGPWVNSARQNVVATIIVAVLVLLSLILTVTTVIPELPLGPFTAAVAIVAVFGLSWMGVAARRRRGRDQERERAVTGDRRAWRMPPLAELRPPVWSRAQRLGMLVLRGYLVLAVVLLAVKIGQLALAR
ncbi:MAG: divalent metal cation transporter [Candidatus Dormibacteraeota bacterium]|jgi:NRAMP (natural resistance-associated macrophage protein)-like metal ion transporter|nr:divalent metal cation transporter [Candidatus Dormibacteraeota bacterium]